MSVYTISSQNNHASIFNSSLFSVGKVNLDDAFGRSKFKIPSSFISALKKKQKIKEEQEFLSKICF